MMKASSNVSLFAAFSALWACYEDGHNASCAAVPVAAGGLRVKVGESSGPAVGRQSGGPAVPCVSARPQRDARIYE